MDSKEVRSLLRFVGYDVDELQFVRNFEYEDLDEEVEIDFRFSAGRAISKSGNKAIVNLFCTIFDEDFSDNSQPFYLKMGIRGYFECESDVNIREFELNAVSILLPFMRAIITSFTSQCGISPVIIPPINVFNMLNGEDDDEDDQNM